MKTFTAQLNLFLTGAVLCGILNVGLLTYNNAKLTRELQAANNTIAAQTVALHRYQTKAVQRDDIYVELHKRNRHVPAVVLSNWALNIQRAAETYQVPVPVLMSLYRIESAMVHYDSRGFLTVSNKNAGGLGQIMPFWYKACPHSVRPDDLDNASVNIMCSAFILRHYLDENDNNLFLALTAYNSGPRGVRLIKRGHDITNGYAIKILQKVA